jgi:NAD(P)-dependent dehydrogenase (short-subunit alcohol dehydrogenase family)
MRPIAEQKILVTGATDGLGKGVATALARAGATLLLHGRDEARGAATMQEIRELTGNDALSYYNADFASLAEVRALADQILAEHEELHTLVNNAGIGSTLPGGGARMESADGYELRFAVNYLAAFLLTQHLVPLLFKSAPARIVNVSSLGQMPIDFEDVMLEHRYSGVRAYCQSKLADVMLTFDLADEMPRRAVTVNCLHPASFMPTKIVLAARGTASSTLEEGVDATMRLIADPELDGVTGRYFTAGHGSRANPQAYDEDARRQLRELSERLVEQAQQA